MSTYVMSDLHGNFCAYQKMLEKIELKSEDKLYILGDILDRGPNPIKIILDLMNRPNVEILAGNHCVMACECFEILLQEITEESLLQMDETAMDQLLGWQLNGGASTINELRQYDKETQKQVLRFIQNFSLYDEIEVSGKTYVLVHAGLGNFAQDKELWEYELDELVWERADYGRVYYEDKYVITGHTPTMGITENPRPGYIYQANQHIAIDCGCNFPQGRLGCLRLEDMKEFYV